MSDEISDERVERAQLAYMKKMAEMVAPDSMFSVGREPMRAALESDAPALAAERARGVVEGLTEAREIASKQFGWDIDTWRDMTKKDMTRLMAEAIVAAIDARIAELGK